MFVSFHGVQFYGHLRIIIFIFSKQHLLRKRFVLSHSVHLAAVLIASKCVRCYLSYLIFPILYIIYIYFFCLSSLRFCIFLLNFLLAIFTRKAHNESETGQGLVFLSAATLFVVLFIRVLQATHIQILC